MKTNILFSYNDLKETYPIDLIDLHFLSQVQQTIKNIFLKKEKKIIVFTGPCSIHDEESTILYAQKLKDLQKNLKNIFLIMRVFFEKSRSKDSWKGYLYDPDLDNTFDIEKGIINVRKLLLKITKLNIPICCEFLDPNVSCYFDDLISWGFIGARTVYSTFHRQFASSMSIPIGFKNSLDGDVSAAINGAIVAKNSQNFISINNNGKICKKITNGNNFSHIVLRGSNTSINYDEISIDNALNIMKNVNFPIIIDCSHGNAQNNHSNQINVFKYVTKNLLTQNYPIIGLMLESHLNEGNQLLNALNLRFGLSITDPCISFDETKRLILFAEDFLIKALAPHQ